MTQVEETMQAERTERAQSEHFGFARVRRADGTVEIWVHSFTSRKDYTITKAEGCNCGDYVHRCAGRGLECKHMQAMRLAHREGKIKELTS